jgi:hypothetical protein
MKTKKTYMIKTAALALILALAACANFTGPEAGPVPGEPIPQGMGLALIRLGAREGSQSLRTVLPDDGGYYFTLGFTAPGKTPVNKTLSDGMTLTVALEPAVWRLEVKGYADSDMTSLKVTGSVSVPITAGTTSNCDVYLAPDFNSGAVGTLNYSISFPGTVTRAFFALYPLDVPGTSAVPAISREIDISTSARTGTLSIPEGSYQVLIDLYDGGGNKAAVWTSVAHINDSSTTTLTRDFDTANFAGCPPVVGTGLTTLAAKLDAALASPSGSYTVILDGTETDLGHFTPKTFTVTGNRDITITIRGNGKQVQYNSNVYEMTPLITLEADSNSSLALVVQDLTLKGQSPPNRGTVVQVEARGTLEMKAGSLITGNTNSGNGSTGGGGVYVNGGTLWMSGGAISGNTTSNNGGGVYVNGGTFRMSGGLVSGNTASSSSGGGVIVDNNGTFSISGGSVSNNSSSNTGGGVSNGGTFSISGGSVSGNSSFRGGGVNNGGTFNMSGGTVDGNSSSTSGGGVYNFQGGIFRMSGGAVSSNSATTTTNNPASEGGGVYNDGTFDMSGGSVTGNSAITTDTSGTSTIYGGGVSVGGHGTFTMSGGSVRGNSSYYQYAGPSYGGGVYIHSGGTFTMSDGTVSGNSSNHGGGVSIDSNGTFAMSSGLVSDNSTSPRSLRSDNYGGGVYSDGTFNMSGGTVSGNSSSWRPAGVYVNGGTFTMGDGTVSGNIGHGVYVYSGATFSMSEGRVSGNSSGVYADGIFSMSDGTVSGNHSGGVYVSSRGTFTMSGGTVSGNKSDMSGYDVQITTGTFRISGAARPERVFLDSNSGNNYAFISIIGPLSDGLIPIDLGIYDGLRSLADWENKRILSGDLANFKTHFILGNVTETNSPYTETPITGYTISDEGRVVRE